MFSPKHFEELVIDDIVVFYVAKCEMWFVDCFLFMVNSLCFLDMIKNDLWE